MRMLCAVLPIVGLVVGLSASGARGAGSAVLTYYGGSLPYTTDITTGRDGNLWFTEYDGGSIGKITPSGKLSTYGGSLGSPDGIAAGADGNVWFVEQSNGKVGKITPKGVITEYDTGAEDPGSIAAGADGNMWFTDDNHDKIGKITPGGVVTEYGGAIKSPNSITRGPDGNMWFTEKGKIGKITPAGRITQYGRDLDSPDKITRGPDGRLWFVKWGDGRIGAITTAGKLTLYGLGHRLHWVRDIAAGPDGNLWFTQQTTFDLGRIVTIDSKIGRITPAGTISLYAGPRAAAELALGPDKNLWFVDGGYVRRGGRHGSIGKFVPALASGPVAPVADASVPGDASLAAVLQRTVPAARTEFATLRGALVDAGGNSDVYVPKQPIRSLCGLCAFADEFGDASYRETWTFDLTWDLPASWNAAKTAAYVERMLRPYVSGYTLSRASNGGKRSFDWENKAGRTWVYATTLGGGDHGFSLRVGYYPRSEAHVVTYSRGLSADQERDLANAVGELVRVGAQNAYADFANLRGRSTSPQFYDANQSFGSMLERCSIDDVTEKWTLDCSTPSLGGTEAKTLALIRSAVEAALPGGFVSTTDPQYLFLDDYRWDRSSDRTAVTISHTSGTFTITIFHFN